MKITIITVCYNSERYIEQTIRSVINQTYKDIEYIIVDGMSTDSTPQIIERYQPYISKYIRGKDKNMYDAINKGMAVSTGDYIDILNSDDTLCNEHVIENVVSQIEKYKDKYEVFYGEEQKYYQYLGITKARPKMQTTHMELLCSRRLTFMGHGAVFISRKVYERLGNYDCDNYSASSDFDYFLRVSKIFPSKYIKTLTQTFRVHEASITSSGRVDAEVEPVLRKNGYYEINPVIRALYFSWGWFRFWMINIIPMMKFYYQKATK